MRRLRTRYVDYSDPKHPKLPQRAEAARATLAAVRLTRCPYQSLLPRVWELRANAGVYDALYLALAEELDCPLVTTDTKHVTVPGIRCQVDTIQSP
jgi:predicted nucleic acid-binding protein